MRKTYPEIIEESTRSLFVALEDIFSQTHKGFIFIIDEWDCIFREKQKDTAAQTVYLDFLRDLFKDQPYVNLVYMTGILPIKKYGAHSALNMFREFSMTDSDVLSPYVGFMESEVQALCKVWRKDFQETQRWYDGYQFYNQFHVYNPKSVVDAMQSLRFGSFWTQTETYEALRVYIDMNFDGLKDAIIQMLGGGRCIIDTSSFTNDMTAFQIKDDVLTLLVHLGYLGYDTETKQVFIPNEEIRLEFVTSIRVSDWQEVIKSINASEALLREKGSQICFLYRAATVQISPPWSWN